MVHGKNNILNVNVSAIQVFSNIATNGSQIASNTSVLLSSSGVASLVFSGSPVILITGEPPFYLPEVTVLVNVSFNYTRIRVIMQATSPSLAFVPGEQSYIEVMPKCSVGEYVAFSATSYDCVKCPDGLFTNHVDSATCRFEYCVPLFGVAFHSTNTFSAQYMRIG